MKILHALRSVDPAEGGPVEGVRQLARLNRESGHWVEVVSLDAPNAPWLSGMGIPVHAVGPGFGVYGYSPHLIPWLKENVGKYDCVIINGIWQYNTYGAWRGLQGSGVPYFVFPHGMLDPWFKHRYPLKHAKKWLYWTWGVFPVLRDAAGVMFTCEQERVLARQSFWLYDCDELVVGYGTHGVPIRDADYRNAFIHKHKSLAGKRLILFLGRVHPKKGLELAIGAIALLVKKKIWNQSSTKLVIAGPSDDRYVASLKQLIARVGISGCVEWAGMVMGEEKWGCFQAADAFILPSHQENFGIAVVEALSVGTPVIITKKVNIWEDIVNGGAGLASEDSVDGVQAVLAEWLTASEAKKASIRSSARTVFSRRYNASSFARYFLSRVHMQITASKLSQ